MNRKKTATASSRFFIFSREIELASPETVTRTAAFVQTSDDGCLQRNHRRDLEVNVEQSETHSTDAIHLLNDGQSVTLHLI